MKPFISEIGKWMLSNVRKEMQEYHEKHGTYEGFTFVRDGVKYSVQQCGFENIQRDADEFCARIGQEIEDAVSKSKNKQ